MSALKLTASQTRAQDSQWVAQCRWQSLQARLPLLWPTPGNIPPSPKGQYRSWYTYPGYEKLTNPAEWENLPLFEVLLSLVDFSGLRPVLAQQLGWRTARGQVPFDPVSLFLLVGWQLSNSWNRAVTLRNVARSRYADLVHCFGFRDGVYPTEGGLRYFLTTLGQNSPCHDQAIVLGEDEAMAVARQQLNQLIAQSVHLLLDAGIISPEAWHKASICPDGMLHEAASRLRCVHVRDSCYEVTTADHPRPCPAQDKGRQGCACDPVACVPACRSAPPRDAAARFVCYQGHNQPDHSPNKATDPAKQTKGRGRAVYGYRSLPLLLADPHRRFSVILADDFQPANEPEPPPVAALLKQLPDLYPTLNVDAVAGDAAFGTDLILSIVYHDLQARRVIDLRGHQTDKDPLNWLLRGYDDKGRPLCPFGYRLTANGYDAKRQRRKYFCNRVCTQGAQPVIEFEAVPQPPRACPHLSADSSRGLILNVGQRFADGSSRLVRDVLVGSPMWKTLYHRPRNASEGRNAAFEKWRLKRLSVFGQSRGRATIMLADVWLNLTTLARLLREATLARPP
jgi:hypothetical protein